MNALKGYGAVATVVMVAGMLLTLRANDAVVLDKKVLTLAT